MTVAMERMLLAQERLRGPAKKRAKLEHRQQVREWKRRQKLASKQSDKELSAHELAAIGAVTQALDTMAEKPVYLNFVRRFRSTKAAKRDYVVTCVVQLSFGFRCLETDRGGTGEAVVQMRETIAADSQRLAHSYFVWVPVSAKLSIEQATVIIQPVNRKIEQFPLGNRDHVWWFDVTSR